MKRLLFYSLLIALVSCSGKKSPADYVNPFIGTDYHGHTFPGATLPFGLVQLSPDTGTEGWDWCSGYHSSDSSIMGFSHSHLSGTGAADLGDILFMPTLKPEFTPGEKDSPDQGYRSRFNHDSEKAEAGYYSVFLDDVSTWVELTATEHVGVQRYTFETSCNHYVMVDLSHGIADTPTDCYIKKISDRAIEGYRTSRGWADEHTVYFYAEFSSPFISNDKSEEKGEKVVSALEFSSDVATLEIRTGISYVDIQGAKNNLETETSAFDFETIKQNAYDSWNNALSKIKVDGDKRKKEIFYTAMYHSMIAPYLMSDADGRYRSSNRKVYSNEEPNYGLFSTWDTFRALHPLMTIVAPDKNVLFVKSMIRYYQESGRLPIWDLNMRENFCMIGYHSVPIIADAFFKGEKFDAEKALEAMLKSSTEDTYSGLGYYRHFRFIPCDIEPNSVSKTLEYAYDDWCIAKMAKALGRDDIYKEYIKRAQYYKCQFDPKDTFMKGRDSNGRFRKDFSPTQISILGQNDFTEGNSWHYSFFAPQDVNTLIQMMGGDEKFSEKLDELFNSETVTDNASPDVSGLIGNYAHGNEPSHHAAYLYAYAGKQWKTAEKVAKICSEMYSNERDGLCGNEDCGQMSAWYVLSAMGFYEVTPGSCMYVLGSPQFENIVILNDNGSQFEIEARGLSEKNIYISDATFNGEPYTKGYITHDMIVSGGKLVLNMQDKPQPSFASKQEDRPVSEISDYVYSSKELLSEITLNPYIDVEERFFNDKIIVSPLTTEADADIYYSLDGKDPLFKGKKVTGAINIRKDCNLNMIARNRKTGIVSSLTTYEFHEGRIEDAKITFSSKPAEQYSGNGAISLTDGLSGTTRYRSGGWLGWNGGDFTIKVELPKPRWISFVGVDFLASVETWIAPPTSFIIEIERENGKTESKVVKMSEGTDKKLCTCYMGENFFLVRAKTIRIKIPKNYIPKWHRSHGKPAWVFIDEITVK